MLAPATPPPTMTACASSTSLGSLRSVPYRSHARRRVLEPAGEPGIAGALQAPGEVTSRIVDVIEVQGGQTLLHDAPHRLAEVRHDPHELQSGHAGRGDPAEVQLEEQHLGVLAHAVVDREVPQIEEQVQSLRTRSPRS